MKNYKIKKGDTLSIPVSITLDGIEQNPEGYTAILSATYNISGSTIALNQVITATNNDPIIFSFSSLQTANLLPGILYCDISINNTSIKKTSDTFIITINNPI